MNRLTEKLRDAVSAARSKAIRNSHQQIDLEHLLATLLEQVNGLALAGPPGHLRSRLLSLDG